MATTFDNFKVFSKCLSQKQKALALIQINTHTQTNRNEKRIGWSTSFHPCKRIRVFKKIFCSCIQWKEIWESSVRSIWCMCAPSKLVAKPFVFVYISYGWQWKNVRKCVLEEVFCFACVRQTLKSTSNSQKYALKMCHFNHKSAWNTTIQLQFSRWNPHGIVLHEMNIICIFTKFNQKKKTQQKL